MADQNRIIEVRITATQAGAWNVAVTKEFAPEYGGGSQVFQESAGSLHHALDVARGMVTVSAGQRTDLPARTSQEVPR